jgi:hypothetical protein
MLDEIKGEYCIDLCSCKAGFHLALKMQTVVLVYV